MDHINFPYRSASHLSLLHVIGESGAWERHGLDVNYDQYIGSEDAHRKLPAGEVEFVGGNHVSTYAHRARGDKWIYLGQTINRVVHKLCVKPDSGIFGIEDLFEKKFVVRGSHPSLNDWLFLKQHGLDEDRDDIELINQLKLKPGSMDAAENQDATAKLSKWEWVKQGNADACLLTAVEAKNAERAGMKVIDVDSLPMINFTTISAHQDFVEKNPDLVERFIKGLMEGIAYLKNNPEEARKIIKQRFMDGKLDDETVAEVYAELARIVEPRLYPSMQAIDNVYQEAIRQDADAKKINPMSLWNVNYIRRIEDQGFIEGLYGNKQVR